MQMISYGYITADKDIITNYYTVSSCDLTIKIYINIFSKFYLRGILIACIYRKCCQKRIFFKKKIFITRYILFTIKITNWILNNAVVKLSSPLIYSFMKKKSRASFNSLRNVCIFLHLLCTVCQ